MRKRPFVTALAERPRRNGFSLVEMMVVLFVMGVLTTAVVLLLPGDADRLRRETERFAARASAARDQAIASGAPVAVVVSEAGYYFEERRDGAWSPAHRRGLALTDWSEGTVVAVATPGGQTGGRARIVFDPVGLASSDLHVRLSRGGQARGLTIARNGTVQADGLQ